MLQKCLISIMQLCLKMVKLEYFRRHFCFVMGESFRRHQNSDGDLKNITQAFIFNIVNVT